MTKKDEIKYIKKDDEYYKNIIEKFEEFNKNGKKTICYFCDTYYPIIDGVIVVLDNYACQQSHNYNIVVCVPSHKGDIPVCPNYIVLGTKSHYFKFVNYDLGFPNKDKKFKEALKHLRIDIVHSHSPFNFGKFACKIAKERNVPLVCTFHSQYKQDFFKSTKSRLLSAILLKNAMKKFKPATEVWTMHEGCMRVIKEYGYKGKLYKVPNATNKVRPSNIDELKKIANEKWGLQEEKNVFLFVGRLVSQKNIFLIPKALKILKEKGIPFKMFYAGSGPDGEKLKQLIKKLDLEQEITLLGQVSYEDLDLIYARSTLMLFPSVYDTSSLTQIEASVYDTPALLIKDTVTAGTITDNKNGFLALNNAKSYAERIMQIISDEKLYNEVSSNVYKDLYVTHDDLAKIVHDRYEFLMKQNKK